MNEQLTPCKLQILAIGAMSSSGKDTNEASPKKKISGKHSNFRVEWLRDPDLKG